MRLDNIAKALKTLHGLVVIPNEIGLKRRSKSGAGQQNKAAEDSPIPEHVGT